MDISEADVEAAEERLRQRQAESGFAVAARYDASARRIVVSMNTGIEFSFPVMRAQGLVGAAAADLSNIEISPSGLGLHWPSLDADLLVAPLLHGVFGSKTWMASLMGEAGGKSRSRAKTAAARVNGKKGGRPRKKVSV